MATKSRPTVMPHTQKRLEKSIRVVEVAVPLICSGVSMWVENN